MAPRDRILNPVHITRRGALAVVARTQAWTLRKMPWLRAVFAGLVRFRWPLMALLAVLCAIVPQIDPAPNDIDIFFLGPAYQLVRHGDLGVFAANIQVGPLCLALLGIGAVAGSGTGLSGTNVASAVMGLVALGITAATVRAVLPLGTSRERRAAYELCLGVVLIWTCTPLASSYGHIEEMFLALMLVITASEVRRGHGARAGLWLGLALAFKLWAVVGIVVLVLAPTRRAALRAAVVAAIVGVLSYAPFVLRGHFRTFDFRWTLQRHVPMSYVLGSESPFDFRARFLQVALSCAVGLFVAIRLRRDVRAVWLVPATAIAVRLLTDPMLLPYYWTGLAACFVVGVAVTDWPPVLRAATGIAIPAVVLTAVIVLRDHPNRAILTLMSVGAVAVCLWVCQFCARRPAAGRAEGALLSPENAGVTV
ncbi:MAG: alpha,2-mannosyltransferase [Frankiaceae bacterium]|nr:alpha,2-mannosyltransferase [Frankiaceae bacterium]